MFSKSVISVVFVFFILFLSVSIRAQFGSSISGMIFDAETRRPVAGVEVELVNDVYTTIGRLRTESSGRYYFSRLSGGNYKIRILALGTNYIEQTQDVTLNPFVIAGRETPDSIYHDFYLKINTNRVNASDLKAGTLFAQDVPPEALALYNKAISQLNDRNKDGLVTLENAIKIFPEYYDALDLLGNQYVERKEYTKALPFLIRAIDVNQRSYSSYYAIGYACFNINKYKEAIEALRAATILHPDSVNAHLMLGTASRLGGTFEEAEKALKQAEKLAPKPMSQTHWQLALLYNKHNKNKEAAEQLEIFLKLEPNSPDKQKILDTIAKLKNSK